MKIDTNNTIESQLSVDLSVLDNSPIKEFNRRKSNWRQA